MTFLTKTKIDDVSDKSHDFKIDGYEIHYVAIRTREKKNFFGKFDESGFKEKAEGKIVAKAWKELPSKFPACYLGDFKLYPNEFHGLLIFDTQGLLVPAEKMIPVIIGAFKSRAAKLLNLMSDSHNRVVWHNNFVDIRLDYMSQMQDALVFLNGQQ